MSQRRSKQFERANPANRSRHLLIQLRSGQRSNLTTPLVFRGHSRFKPKTSVRNEHCRSAQSKNMWSFVGNVAQTLSKFGLSIMSSALKALFTVQKCLSRFMSLTWFPQTVLFNQLSAHISGTFEGFFIIFIFDRRLACPGSEVLKPRE